MKIKDKLNLGFKGFKGKYIYWGMGALVIGILIGTLGSIALGSIKGFSILVVYLVIVFAWIWKQQSKGLYSKRRESNTLFCVKNNLR